MAAKDPRSYQIAVLGGLLSWGVLALGFRVGGGEIAVLVGAALATQWLCARLVGVRFDGRSPLISSLSLSLLARASSPGLLALTAVVAIASKFALRRRGKHVFNPTAFGLAALAAASGGEVWISPGQWGSGVTMAFLVACAGGLVVHRAARADVTWAFLGAYAGLVLLRAAWLGDPWAVPLHSLDSGALLIFAFFMISDPKTTPDSRAGRIAYAALVAAGATFVGFALHRPDGPLWALVCSAPLVPTLDRLLPGERYRWHASPSRRRAVTNVPSPDTKEPSTMTFTATRPRSAGRAARVALLLLALALAVAAARPAAAFCGFYVAKADARLFNQASQVVLARSGERTVLTMANDFRGDPRDFAIVIPVPTLLEREQIRVADQGLIDHLDAYTAPRLVEYFDPDPCAARRERRHLLQALGSLARPATEATEGDGRALGVTIEARYAVGEYEILILSAEESRGLERWLTGNGYRLPPGAARVLASYLRQGMKFFVAKVDLDEQERLGFTNLRPLQVAFETAKFMLPIRLGTVNADGPQELFVYTLTRRGRVETTNYRTRELPTGMEVPVFVKDEFGDFYRDLFATRVERDGMRSVYLEYAWDMAWCDPCAADPLSRDQLRRLGVFWLEAESGGGAAQDVFVTRLHLRYDGETFPADLRFQETADRSNFQGRYVLRHPWRGAGSCRAADDYRQGLGRRLEREARTLASLTGWEIEGIRERIAWHQPLPAGGEPWWRRLWGDGGP